MISLLCKPLATFQKLQPTRSFNTIFYPLRIFKGRFPQILLGPLLNNLSSLVSQADKLQALVSKISNWNINWNNKILRGCKNRAQLFAGRGSGSNFDLQTTPIFHLTYINYQWIDCRKKYWITNHLIHLRTS